ncbi:SMI1/KNR4 family protein [Paenibacillus sp. OVF10]|nr:SMI1/KNR4 family protein [Paenibacillus sp. OVF10]
MYSSLIEKLEHTEAIRWFPNHQVQESWIVEVEQELGFSLPPSYRWWLLNYGQALLSGTEILTITSSEHREYTDADILYRYRLADEEAKKEGSWSCLYRTRMNITTLIRRRLITLGSIK